MVPAAHLTGHVMAGVQPGDCRLGCIDFGLRGAPLAASAWRAQAPQPVPQPMLPGIQALSPHPHPSTMPPHALLARADPLSAHLQAVVGHRQAMFPRLHRLSMALHTMLMLLHSITIVLIRMSGHQHKVKSYQYRMLAPLQALLIVFYRMWVHVDEVKGYQHRLLVLLQRMLIALHRMCGLIQEMWAIDTSCAGDGPGAWRLALRDPGVSGILCSRRLSRGPGPSGPLDGFHLVMAGMKPWPAHARLASGR